MSEYDHTIENLEATNRERLEGWFNLIGMEPSYPVASDTVVRLLRAVEYDLDNDRLIDFVNSGVIPPVDRRNGRLAWSATAIVSLACAAEARRMWQPFSQLHGHKRTTVEKIRELAEHEGSEGAFRDLAEFDWDALLAMGIDVACDRSATVMMIEAIRQKLKTEGIL